MGPDRKYLMHVGKKRIALDRRDIWARESRDYVEWDSLSGGEQKRRRRFAILVQGGMDPVEAIKLTLNLDEGRLAEVHPTDVEWDEFWSREKLIEVANRWLGSRHFEPAAREAVRAAHLRLGAAAPEMADVLVKVARDPDSSALAKATAAKAVLEKVGLVAGTKIEQNARQIRSKLQQRARKALAVIKAPARIEESTPEVQDEGADTTEAA